MVEGLTDKEIVDLIQAKFDRIRATQQDKYLYNIIVLGPDRPINEEIKARVNSGKFSLVKIEEIDRAEGGISIRCKYAGRYAREVIGTHSYKDIDFTETRIVFGWEPFIDIEGMDEITTSLDITPELVKHMLNKYGKEYAEYFKADREECIDAIRNDIIHQYHTALANNDNIEVTSNIEDLVIDY